MRSDLIELFMPDGKIPLPAVSPSGARTPGNLFDMRSRRMERDLFLDSELEWLNAKRIDANPDILWFCEHYPKKTVWVDTRWKTTVFDMLVCYRDYRFLLTEVKYHADAEPQPGTDTWWQLRAQKTWCEEHNVHYVIADEFMICKNKLELKNINKILGILHETPPESVCLAVMESLSHIEAVPMRKVIMMLACFDEDDVIRAVCSLIFKGLVAAPLDSHNFNKVIPLKRC